jgi:hypothetical protein
MQQGILFQCLEERQPGAYILQIVCRLCEDLKVRAFERAWQRVVERHCVLRTRIAWDTLEEPLQEVLSDVAISFQFLDWRGLSQSEQQDRLAVYLKKDRLRGFSLSEAPLMRLMLCRLAEADYQLVWTCHHIILDRYSLTLVLKEVFAFYESYCGDVALELERPRPYRDYICWLQDQDLTVAEEFWREYLQGFTEPTMVSMTHHGERRSAGDDAYGEQVTLIDSGVVSELRFVAASNQLTLSTIIHGAWAVLLSRLSGKEEVVFGVSRGCRSIFPQAESMVGLFVNTVPLRVRVPPEASLLLWLKELRKQLNAIRAHEHNALFKIQAWGGLRRGEPLLETLLNYDRSLNLTLKTSAEAWTNRDFVGLTQTSYPLTLRVYAASDLTLKLDYDRRLFSPECAGQILDHFKTLIESMSSSAHGCLDMLEILNATERQSQTMEKMKHNEYRREKLRNIRRRGVNLPETQGHDCG